MTLPPPPPPLQEVHEPEPDDREPRTRLKMMLGDRLKVLVLIALFILLSAAYLHSKIPIMSYWEALQDQLRAKWWLVGLFGLEVLRQLHYLICERVGGYNQFWEKHVWGAWERRVGRMNPWRRYRINRLFRFTVFTIIAVMILGALWGTSFVDTLTEAPSRLWDIAFGPLQGEALDATLTIQIKETPTGSALRFDYVVGGYMRFKVAEIAPAVDKVIGEQLVGLANALGGALPPTRDEKAAEEPAVETPEAKEESGLDAAVAVLVPELDRAGKRRSGDRQVVLAGELDDRVRIERPDPFRLLETLALRLVEHAVVEAHQLLVDELRHRLDKVLRIAGSELHRQRDAVLLGDLGHVLGEGAMQCGRFIVGSKVSVEFPLGVGCGERLREQSGQRDADGQRPDHARRFHLNSSPRSPVRCAAAGHLCEVC